MSLISDTILPRVRVRARVRVRVRVRVRRYGEIDHQARAHGRGAA